MDIEEDRQTKYTSRKDLPDLLPAEFLEDDDDQDLAVVRPAQAKEKSKKTKLADLEKKPKDRRKGSVTYRIAEVTKASALAPKSTYIARSMKEKYLEGRAGKGKSINRKPLSSSFFKSK